MPQDGHSSQPVAFKNVLPAGAARGEGSGGITWKRMKSPPVVTSHSSWQHQRPPAQNDREGTLDMLEAAFNSQHSMINLSRRRASLQVHPNAGWGLGPSNSQMLSGAGTAPQSLPELLESKLSEARRELEASHQRAVMMVKEQEAKFTQLLAPMHPSTKFRGPNKSRPQTSMSPELSDKSGGEPLNAVLSDTKDSAAKQRPESQDTANNSSSSSNNNNNNASSSAAPSLEERNNASRSHSHGSSQQQGSQYPTVPNSDEEELSKNPQKVPSPEGNFQRPEGTSENVGMSMSPTATSIHLPPGTPGQLAEESSDANSSTANQHALASSFLPGRQDDCDTKTVGKESVCSPDGSSTAQDRRRGDVSESQRRDFQLLDEWMDTSRVSNDFFSPVKSPSLGRSAKLKKMNFTMAFESEAVRSERSCEGLHPNSKFRSGWDLTSLLLVCLDLFLIPLSFFDLPESPFRTSLTWLTRLFWSFDMFLSCITGFVMNDGTVQRNLAKILKRYLLTWFCLDLLVVGVDWLEIFSDVESTGLGFVRISKSARIFRLLRFLRLLRLMKMRDVINSMIEQIYSEWLIIMVDIGKVALVIFGFGHLLACCWYGVGDIGTHNWVAANDLKDLEIGHRYFVSLHWALSQFTGGMDEFRPVNMLERIFAVVVFIFAFVTSSVFVSSLTSSMTRLQIVTSYNSAAFARLRRYLVQNKVSQALTVRIKRNAKHILKEQQNYLPEARVELLELVSEPLLKDLHFEIYAATLSAHPFFDRYNEECPHVMRKVCHQATATMSASSGDMIFEAGEIPAVPKMFFLVSGTLQYTSLNGGVVALEAFDWVCEACLWTVWMHQGVLLATAEVRMVALDAQDFVSIVARFDHSDYDPRTYAAHFIRRLNEQLKRDELTDLGPETVKTFENDGFLRNVSSRVSRMSRIGGWGGVGSPRSSIDSDDD
mmetsp:Transcript_25827/g.54861  ORF Transcript_25827/g.54861 Transcript_25827/m.54861 type:complete len:939 (+) Transcript_25827:36-2852(+)